MSGTTVVKTIPESLPTSAAGFLLHRKLKAKRTLNDMVEEIHLLLVEDEKYIDLLNAVYDEQAVEGSLSADNLMAANMIRTQAVKMNSGLSKEKLATISKALNIVLRRYQFSRKERRDMVAGESVQNIGGE